MENSNKIPLQIYVIWDKNFKDGRKYADKIFDMFSYGNKNYNGESIGIPVYYINDPHINNYKNEANLTMYIPLIENHMCVNADEWGDLFRKIEKDVELNDDSTTLYLISFGNATMISVFGTKFANNNALILNEGNFNDRWDKLSFELAHDLCRMLFGMSIKQKISSNNNGPVKVFISHARKDGQSFAIEINNYITTKSKLKTFLDINDIPIGCDFNSYINKILKNDNNIVVLLVILTDTYSSRNMCQGEILSAKENGCPILLVDALENGEKRSFPYSTNEKTIRCKNYDEIQIRKIIFEVLIETLKEKYNQMFLEYIALLYNITDYCIFNNPPELYTLLTLKKEENKIIIYPEPKMNSNELKVLKKYLPNQQFITPTEIPLFKEFGNSIINKDIGISISELLIEGENARTNSHLLSFYIELCRYIFATGGNIVYAGVPHYGQYNCVEKLYDLASNYLVDEFKNRIKIYLQNSEELTINEKSEMLPYVKFYELDIDSKLKDIDKLSELRKKVCDLSSAQVFIGGKTEKYQGKCPGVIEEAYYAFKKGKPIFIVGGFGGAASYLANILCGKKIKNLEPFDEDILLYLRSIGIDKLNNGLTIDENKELFTSTNYSRCIFLIFKGLIRAEV